MKTVMKYLLAAVTVVAVALCIRSIYVHRKDKEKSKSILMEKYISAYRKEKKEIKQKEKIINAQTAVLDQELTQAESDTANSVEAGMKVSFIQGINYGLHKRNMSMIRDGRLQMASLHSKYDYMVRGLGYDWVEFEQLMCLEDSIDTRDSLCNNLIH